MVAKYIRRGRTLLKYFKDKEQLNMLLDYGTYGAPRIGIITVVENASCDALCVPKRGIFVYDETFANDSERDLLFGCCLCDKSQVMLNLRGFKRPTFKTDRTFNHADFFNLPSNQVDAYILEDDFFDKLKEFEETNIKRHNKAVAEKALEEHKLSFFLSEGSLQIYDWCYKNLQKNIDLFANLMWILRIRKKYKSKQRQLARGSITSYVGDKDIDELMGELIKLKENADIAKAISTFNTQQRKILKEAYIDGFFTKRERALLMKVHRLTEERRKNIIQKVSDMDDIVRIMETISISVGASFCWSRKSLYNHIKGYGNKMNLDFIYDNNNVVVIKANDFKTISYLGKTTNWCITKDLEYWENYTTPRGNEQYVILNFNLPENDDYSIIGVTTKDKKAICAAHSFTNKDLLFYSNPYVWYPINENVFGYLSSLGIMGKLIKKQLFLGAKNIGDVLYFLNENVSNNYIVIDGPGNKHVIISDAKEFGYFLEEHFFVEEYELGLPLSTSEIAYAQKYMLLIDLDETNDLSKRIQTIIIVNQNTNDIIAVDGVMKTISLDNIDWILSKYNVSLSDYIPIPSDKYNQFIYAIEKTDSLNALNMLLTDDDIRNRLGKSYRFAIKFYGALCHLYTITLMDYVKREEVTEDNLPLFWFIKKLYDNGYTIGKLNMILPVKLINFISTLYSEQGSIKYQNDLIKKYLLEIIKRENIDIRELLPETRDILDKIFNKTN